MFKIVEMKQRINTLENENETLKSAITDELWKAFIDKLGEPEEIKKLKTDNKRLRQQLRTLKENTHEKDNRKRKTTIQK